MVTRRWERARARDGQLVMIVGEPGLGKSRLIEEFHARLRETPHRVGAPRFLRSGVWRISRTRWLRLNLTRQKTFRCSRRYWISRFRKTAR